MINEAKKVSALLYSEGRLQCQPALYWFALL